MGYRGRILRGAFATVSTAALLGFGLPALAQDAPAAAPAAATPSPDQATAVGEIVVTAQKRTERLADVPISIVALSGTELTKNGINDTRDLTQVTPGMTAASTGYALQPAIRGITSQGTNAGEEANVSLYIDDAYVPAQYSGLMQLRDVQRIEVLKGPQGTLFGRNSTGGAIRVVTRDPTTTPHVELDAAYGFDIQERILSGYIAGPIAPTLTGSLSFYYLRNEGYLENLAANDPANGKDGRQDDIAARAKLMWQPSDMFRYTISVDAGRSRNSAPYALAPIDGNNVNALTPGVILPSEKFQVSQSVDTDMEIRGIGVTGTGQLDFNAVSVKSITAYRYTEGSFAADADRTNLSVGSSTTEPDLFHTRNFSEELQLTSNTDGPLSWLGGLFLYHSDSVQGFLNWIGDPGNILGSAFAGRVQTDSIAPFGEVTYDITDQLSVIAGIRYTHESKQFDYHDIVRPGGLPLRFSEDERTFESVNYRLVGQYKFTDSMNAYASFATGFKSGVYNSSSAVINVVEPESISAFEVGFKGRVAPWLFVTAAAFHYDYSNIQLSAYDTSPGILTLRLTNAAKAKIQGVEASGEFRFGQGWSGNVGLSWIPKAEYEDFPGAVVFPRKPDGAGNIQIAPFDASGTRMIRTPEFTLTAGLTYNFEAFGGDAEVGGNWYHNSGFLLAPGEVNPLAEQGAYDIFNARISWATSDGRYKVTLYGENLGNEAYRTYQSENIIGDSAGFSRPRVIGIRLGYSY